MADFFNEGWSIYITVITLGGILACAWLLFVLAKYKAPRDAQGNVATTGHIYDEDLVELNNPLPRWWLWMFVITIVFSLGYLYLYPGLGSYKGSLGWTSANAHAKEVAAAEKDYGPIYAKYMQEDLKVVAADPDARKIGEKLFINYCAQCHGSDAGGNKGYPNLTDKDWLYGGEPDVIETTILNGRHGVMPSMAAAVGGEDDVRNVANYVATLSGGGGDPLRAQLGKPKFAVCAACHGPEGKGNQALGTPNLTDKIWLHGGGVENIMLTINKGRDSTMPAHEKFLGKEKVHILAAYIWSLSNQDAIASASPASSSK